MVLYWSDETVLPTGSGTCDISWYQSEVLFGYSLFKWTQVFLWYGTSWCLTKVIFRVLLSSVFFSFREMVHTAVHPICFFTLQKNLLSQNDPHLKNTYIMYVLHLFYAYIVLSLVYILYRELLQLLWHRQIYKINTKCLKGWLKER